MTTEAARRHTPALVCLLPGLALLALILGSLAQEGLFDGLRALMTLTPASAESLVRHYSWWPRCWAAPTSCRACGADNLGARHSPPSPT
ncbi:MAG: hypothetical protein ACQEXC_05105 [Pseudomonadota bacterium]